MYIIWYALDNESTIAFKSVIQSLVLIPPGDSSGCL